MCWNTTHQHRGEDANGIVDGCMTLNIDFKRIRKCAHGSMVDTTVRVDQGSDWYKLHGAQKKFNE